MSAEKQISVADGREDVYATLLLNDSYLPGALVLAHSLRDAGTRKKLAVLVTIESLSNETITELGKLYDYIVPVERIVNDSPANLLLMNRLDLGATFTKITLWKQEQFRRIVYIDADIVALRAPDELFDIPYPFSAAPDIGWPDLFNTGVMVLDPNMGDYYALLAMAQRGISFDGADQGLLNMHFRNSYNRLSFTYNVTPSGHYQYVPAYRHFQSAINMVHFIGAEKPWMQGRDKHHGGGPYDELVGRWWAVYDRHYRVSSAAQDSYSVPEFIQKYVKGEYTPFTRSYSSYSSSAPERANPTIMIEGPSRNSDTSQEQTQSQPETSYDGSQENKEQIPQQADSRPAQEPFKIEYNTWDPSKAPPPADSKPEASNFPSMVYTMSSDPEPFKAPEKYPDPPKNMYYEVPKTPTFQKPAPIFPWEKTASKPSRVFAEDRVENASPSKTGSESDMKPDSQKSPATTAAAVPDADPWQNYSRGNAWDEMPQIEKYIGSLQKNRKGSLQMLQGYGSGIETVSSPGATRRTSMKLTDFPTELERPSLPVTPAPIRRPNFWGRERDEDGELPAAEGVPQQADWDPVAQLELLAQHQAEVLSLKLGKDDATVPRSIPTRPLPYGSEGVKIHSTYADTHFPGTGSGTGAGTGSETGSGSGSGTATASIAPSTCSQVTSAATTSHVEIEKPSYGGPGAAWEKDEIYAESETPLLPSEEEKDVLFT